METNTKETKMEDPVNCPSCKKDFDLDEHKEKLEWNKFGREIKCPLCSKMIYFTKQAKGLQRDKSGKLVRRFKKKTGPGVK